MEADRADMKSRLKEVYNYNTYDIEESKSPNVNTTAPYSHEQHQAFVSKFSYYMKDTLNAMDTRLSNLRTWYAGEVANRIEQTDDQHDDLQEAVFDNEEAAEKALGRLAEQLLESYADTQDAEFDVLQDAREAAEAAAQSQAEGLKKDIIYAIHVIRYSGGRDLGSYGFGNAASSYYGKGQSLTGYDDLDLFRLDNAFGYAQAANPNGYSNDNDDHHVALHEMLEGAKNGFDDMIQACRDDFAGLVDDENSEAKNRRDQVNADLAAASQAAADSLWNLTA